MIAFLSAGVYRDLLDHVLGKVAELSGHGNIAGLTDTQAAVGSLATRKHLKVFIGYLQRSKNLIDNVGTIEGR